MAKLVGWDKGSSTEQQRKRKITTIILMKGIYIDLDTQCSFLTAQCPAHSRAAIPLPQPDPPAMY